MDEAGVNAAILERLERVVESLQDNSVKMGQLLAVHNEKLDKQDRICLLYTSPSPRDLSTSRMPSSA